MQLNSLPNVFSAQPMPPPAPSSPSPSSTQGVSTPSPSSPEGNASKPDAHPFAAMLKRQQAVEPATSDPVASASKIGASMAEPVPSAGDSKAVVNAAKSATAARVKHAEPNTWIKVEHPAETGKTATVAPSADKDEKDIKDSKVAKEAIVATQQPDPVQCPIDLGLSAVARRAGMAADQGNGGRASDGDDTKAQAASWGTDARTSASPVEKSADAGTDKVDTTSAATRIASRADVSGDKLEAVKHVALDDRTGRVDVPTSGPSSFATTLAQLSGSSAASAPVEVALATPMNAPEFAQALGAQVSLLVADGVQRAELHLNPADMGPVSIEITLDGTQAQVDFGADLASTRHAIEAGLPALASALQDAGFTLHGGGVSQHSARQQGGSGQGSDDGASGSGARGAPAIGSGSSAPAARQRTVMTGGVDVYA